MKDKLQEDVLSGKGLVEFYNYDQRFGAVFYDINTSQYGIKDGEVIDPIRHYFFYGKLLNIACSHLPQGSVLLDVGCGSGILAEKVCDKIGLYVGVDISIERIKQCRKKIKSGKAFFAVADAARLPFKDSSFNAAASLEVIEHIPDTRLFLKEVNRVLSKGASFILSTPGNFVFQNNIGLLGKDQHLYEFSPRKLKAVLCGSSFNVTSIIGIGFKLPAIKIPVWLGSDLIKYIYKKVKGVELKAGYGSPISLQFDLVTNSIFRKIYLKSAGKRPLRVVMEIFDFFARHRPFLSSDM